MKLKPWVKILLFFLLIGAFFYCAPEAYDYFKDFKIVKDVKKKIEVFNILGKSKKEKEKEYEACVNKTYDESELTEELKASMDELTDYINNNYRMSVKYVDKVTGFTYAYKSDTALYAASTIKLLDGLYIFTAAADGTLNLDDTIVYEAKYHEGASKGMQNHDYGEEIPLRTLVKYAIVYSDNTAHRLLLNYIGFNELKNYGKSLGALHTLDGGDNFGEISADDAIIYLQNTYDFIANNGELGKELQGYMLEAEENALKYPGLDVDVGHKYGEYNEYFHDIGIVYDEKPYLVAILTTHGNGNFMQVVNDISQKINDLHQQFKAYRVNECENLKD